MKTKTILAGLAILLAVFLAGWWLGGGSGPSPEEDPDTHDHAADEVWTCSMHPQVRQPGPGTCPICAMDLIPVPRDDDPDETDAETPRLRLSERAAALMNIRTEPVRRAPAEANIRMPGSLTYDETRYARITAWFGGRVDKLHVDSTGVRVRKDEHLVDLYSPQLFAAQEEYLQAVRLAARPGPPRGSEALAAAAREKLRLLGLNDRQIENIRASGKPSTHMTFYSPFDGVVVKRNVTLGQYVETGETLLVLSDLTRLWLELRAYESDLALLRYGQDVEFAIETFPGEVFHGRIAFIEPEVDPVSRTATVRVHVPNPQGRLKPGMFARGAVLAEVGEDGQVIAGELDGKWISPMHPEIIKEGPGECDICGMDLVPVEEMGYFASPGIETSEPLLIPASAPLFTGNRSIVYVRMPDTERPTFEPRAIELGPRLGEFYPVRAGLKEGDLVVTNGQFKIDSELQIRGHPSMMAPGEAEPGRIGETEMGGKGDSHLQAPATTPLPDVLEEFAGEIKPVVAAYLDFTLALAEDNADAALESIGILRQAVEAIGEHRLEGEAHVAWMGEYQQLTGQAALITAADSLEGMRAHLQGLTLAMESTVLGFGGGKFPELKRAYCPMVDGNKGGTWLQTGDTIANPYFGASMLRCGEVLGEL